MSDSAHQLPEAQSPLGDQLDTELLTVSTVQVKRQRIQLCGSGEGATDIVEGGSGAIAIDAYALAIRKALSRSALQTFVSAVTFNVTTQNLSALEFDTGPYTKAILYLDAAISAGSPTALNIAFEHSDDGGTDWFIDLENRVRITDFTEGQRSLIMPAPGLLTRTRLDSEGTDGSNTYLVTLTAEFYNE